MAAPCAQRPAEHPSEHRLPSRRGIEPSMTTVKAADVAVVEREGSTVLLPLDRHNPQPIILGGSAGKIWAAIDGQRGVDELVEHLAAEHDVDESLIRPDVLECLVQFE